MAKPRTPKVFYSSYSQTQRNQFGAIGQTPGQFRQLLIVAVIIVGGYFLTRLPVFQIQTVLLEGSADPALVEELNSLLGTSILSGAVSEKIAGISQLHPELERLECIKGIPNTLRCQASVREAQLAWQSNGHAYLLDRNGVAYQLSDSPAVPVVEDRKNVPVAIGDQLISGEVLAAYRDIQERLVAGGYEINRFFVNTSVLHAGVVLTNRSAGLPFPANPIEVEFSLSYPAATQVTTLNRLLETKASLITARVDLRTPGYLYYK
ncbi:MAG: hypothetical protein WEC83_02170 [Patescibacteria group bacterium]